MFYTMKSIVLFVATSLILIGAIVAIAIPTAVEAKITPGFKWCVGETALCGETKKQCETLRDAVADSPKCNKRAE
jgi:hypothetical protein